MGAYDGAEVCELVGSFLSDKISVKHGKNSIGLYRDNRLSVFKNSTWKNKKELIKNIQGTLYGLTYHIVKVSQREYVNLSIPNRYPFPKKLHL